jgi:beta-galactosidase/beta-glucuronidase
MSLRTTTAGGPPSREEPPLPRAVRERRLSLNGTWAVELDPGAGPLPIDVPWTFEAPLSGIGRGGEVHERIRYRRTFEVPAAWDGLRVLLHFGAVDWHAAVRVDGRPVGEHRGGYTHFQLDLGPLEPGTHELEVDVHDPADGGQPQGKQRGSGGIWYTRTTGIWQPVWLEAVPAVHIRSFELRTSLDGHLEVEIDTTESCDVDVSVDGESTLRVAAPGTSSTVLRDVRLWSPDDPHLYDVRLTAASGDVVDSYVGFRSVERRGRQVLVNGDPQTLLAVLDQAFWPDGIYTAPTDAALRADVEAVRELGFDVARMHVKVADPRWYAWCDRLGVLVVQDIPSSHDLSTEAARETFRHEAAEIVDQLRGHPCVVGWVLINEDWGEPPPAFQSELVTWARAEDPTRLVIDASGWKQLGDTDLLDVHDYGDDLSRHRSAPDRPLWVGECGGVSLPVPGHTWEADFEYRTVRTPDELVDAYRRLLATLGDDVAGFVWTQLTDVEGELNGLLTYDRLPKAPFEAFRRANDELRRRILGA